MNPYHKIKSDADFHAARRLGVGASDIPTLAGLNKRHGQTPLTLWREKRGLAEGFEGNERTDWGKRLEAMVLQKFITGRYGDEAAADFLAGAIRGRSSGPFKVKTEAIHPERRYCLSHADLLVDGMKMARALTPEEQTRMDEAKAEGRAGIFVDNLMVDADPYLVEVKTSGLYSAKRREGVIFEGYDPDDRSQFGVPDKVFMQVQWQLYTYGLTEGWVVVLIDTADYREYGPIVFDPRHVDQSLALAEKFWSMVESGTEPTPITWGDVVSVYADLEDKTAMVSGDEETKASQIVAKGKDLKARAKALDEELDDVKMALGILAGDVVEEDGTVRRTMNRVLNDSAGETIATFRDQTKDSLSLSEWLTEVERKSKAVTALNKKEAKGKTVTPEEWEACQLTANEKEAVDLDVRLRALGAYKSSAPFRVVNY